METIDARRALELLTDLVDEVGEDFVYEKVVDPFDNILKCAYVDAEWRGSCMVGHALIRAGLNPQWFDGTRNTSLSAIALVHHLPDVDLGASQVFYAAQSVQDDGQTWGRALTKARDCYEALMSEADAETEDGDV